MSTGQEMLLRDAGKAIRALRKKGRVEVFLVSPREIKKIERAHLGTHRGEVDVLSFPEPAGFPSPENATKLLGEVYLNKAIMKRDVEHARYLLVHAVLHLVGYTHEKKPDRIRMLTKEKELCRKFLISYSDR